jgi:hypothetical protein
MPLGIHDFWKPPTFCNNGICLPGGGHGGGGPGGGSGGGSGGNSCGIGGGDCSSGVGQGSPPCPVVPLTTSFGTVPPVGCGASSGGSASICADPPLPSWGTE